MIGTWDTDRSAFFPGTRQAVSTKATWSTALILPCYVHSFLYVLCKMVSVWQFVQGVGDCCNLDNIQKKVIWAPNETDQITPTPRVCPRVTPKERTKSLRTRCIKLCNCRDARSGSFGPVLTWSSLLSANRQWTCLTGHQWNTENGCSGAKLSTYSVL